MNDKIKKSYSNIKMSEEAKEKIYQQIMLSDMDDSLEQKMKPIGKKAVLSGWKMGIAACLGAALIVPSGVYAAGKISDYISVNIKKNKYQATIEVHNPKNTQAATEASAFQTEEEEVRYLKEQARQRKERIKTVTPNSYIQVKADFGSEYEFDSYDCWNGYYGYTHKDGFTAGKDFYYEVLYMDESSDSILNLYDQKSIDEIKINGHRALFCESNTVQGSRYQSDYDTSYTLHGYVFYDEYGYMIHYGGMQGLGREQLLALVKKTTVTEASQENASDYGLLSEFSYADTQVVEHDDKEEITLPIKGQNEIVEHDGITYQVTDVKISSQVAKYDTSDPKQDMFLDQCQNLWDENGKLKPYIREKIKYGDGISEPEMTVAGEETIQPKMVYVTMKVKGSGTFQLPGIDFFEKEGGKYYDTGKYEQYNRPENVEFPIVDRYPCYFKETNGGKGYMIKNLKEGEEQIFHFAYVVDGDMTDSMFIHPSDGCWPYNGPYIDISQ